jgi:hypothetical protein
VDECCSQSGCTTSRNRGRDTTTFVTVDGIVCPPSLLAESRALSHQDNVDLYWYLQRDDREVWMEISHMRYVSAHDQFAGSGKG